MSGILYVVATPIGNLEDITLRALKVLQEVDLLACEDTRQSAKLLSHYQIRTPTTSYHEHNEAAKATYLLEQLQAGKRVAILSDAGTPCISDPGYRIVRAALEHHIQVVPIPGASSFVAALSASGRPTDAFTFLGFLPPKKHARLALLEEVREEPRTLVVFESPNRLLDTLQDMHQIMGDRPITVAREITKIFEEFYFGTILQAWEHFQKKPIKGELILIVEKSSAVAVDLDALRAEDLEKQLAELMNAEGVVRNEAIKLLAHSLNVSKRELYRFLLPKETSQGGAP